MMDHPARNGDVWMSQERFNTVKKKTKYMLSKIGWDVKTIPFIPTSAYHGENITERCDELCKKHMPWYKGFEIELPSDKIVTCFTTEAKGGKVSGKNLVDALNLMQPPIREKKKPLRMPVSGVHKIKGQGDVVTGCIEQGTLNTGDKVSFCPSGATGNVKEIQMHKKKLDFGTVSDLVGVALTGLPKEQYKMPKIGDLMFKTNEDKATLPALVKQFTAIVYVIEHPGKIKASGMKQTPWKKKKSEVWKRGYTPTVFVRTKKAPCTVCQIKWKTNKNRVKVENARFMKEG